MAVSPTPRPTEIAERLAAATPGPWKMWEEWEDEFGYLTWRVGIADYDCFEEAIAIVSSVNHNDEDARGNAYLIAHAPSDIGWLLERLAEVTAAGDEVATAISAALRRNGPMSTDYPDLPSAVKHWVRAVSS